MPAWHLMRMEDYFQAKRKLFTSLHLENKSGAAVVNADDTFGARLAADRELSVQLTYGFVENAQLRATNIQLSRERTKFNVEGAGVSFVCNLPLIGRHNIYNALAAIGAALVLNVDAKTIQRALNEFRPVPGRLEAVACGQPFGVFVDYAHTEDSLRHVLQTVREISDGRVLVAFGCGGSRDTGKRAKMGRVAAELADLSWITSDNPRKEKPAAIAAMIEEGFRAVRTDCYRVELDRRRANDEIVREARAGDVVLIAGKGHETYQEFEDTVVPFDDRVYAQETLEALGHKRRGPARAVK